VINLLIVIRIAANKIMAFEHSTSFS